MTTKGDQAMAHYVAGGLYGEGDRAYFALVSPSGDASLPYVWTDPLPYWTHTEHHASLYKLGDDGKTLTLERRCGHDHNPTEHVLTDAQADRVQQRIASGEVYHRSDT